MAQPKIPKIGTSRKRTIELEPFISYNHPTCENALLTADSIIKQWKLDRYKISKNVISNPENVWNGIPFTEDCTCTIRNNVNELNTDQTVCIGCKTLRKICEKNNICYEKTFRVLVGSFRGMNLNAIRISNSRVFSNYQICDKPIEVGRHIMDRHSLMGVCESSFSSFMQNSVFYKYMGSKIGHQLIVSFLMQSEMKKIQMLNIPSPRWVYSCNNTVNLVREVADYFGTQLNEIYESRRDSYSITKSIFIQLVAILHFLNEYAFTHGEPIIDYLQFFIRNHDFSYNGLEFNSPIVLVINPSGSASLSIKNKLGNNIRIYHPGNEIEQRYEIWDLINLEIKPVLSLSSTSGSCYIRESTSVNVNPCEASYLSKRVVTYKINHDYDMFKKYVNTLGVPLFYSSFDLYSFLCELMKIEKFRLDVIQNESLLNIWKQLWIPEELNDVMTNLNDLNLINYHLRCDALNVIWESLKISFNVL